MRFGWIANNIWISVLEEQVSSSPRHELGTPKSTLLAANRKDATKKTLMFPVFSILKAETLPCVCFQFN